MGAHERGSIGGSTVVIPSKKIEHQIFIIIKGPRSRGFHSFCLKCSEIKGEVSPGFCFSSKLCYNTSICLENNPRTQQERYRLNSWKEENILIVFFSVFWKQVVTHFDPFHLRPETLVDSFGTLDGNL